MRQEITIWLKGKVILKRYRVVQRHHKHMSLAMKADLTLRVNCGLVGDSNTDKVDVYMSRGIFFYASLLLKWLKNGEYIRM